MKAVHAGVAAGACREPAAVHRCEWGQRAQAGGHAGWSASSPSSRKVVGWPGALQLPAPSESG